MRNSFRAIVVAACLSAVAIPVAAMDVQPTVNVIRLPTDSGGIRLAVRNPRNVPLPITFEIVERKVNADGTEDQTPADDRFSIFPAQAIIQPGKTQAVKVQWLGGSINQSRSFTLYAAEVPVSLHGQTSGVQRVLRIGASIHVAPQGTASKPILTEAKPDGTGMKVTIRNDGNRFVYVDSLSLAFGDKVVEGTPLADIAGRTLITPGATRTFTVPGVSGQPSLKILPAAL